jgi:hypothetical protein
MKNVAIMMTVAVEAADPLDLYPQLKADVLAASLVAIEGEDERETQVTQMTASQFVADTGGVASFVVNCHVENAFDFGASFDALRAAIATGLGVESADVSIASAEESDISE